MDTSLLESAVQGTAEKLEDASVRAAIATVAHMAATLEAGDRARTHSTTTKATTFVDGEAIYGDNAPVYAERAWALYAAVVAQAPRYQQLRDYHLHRTPAAPAGSL